MMVEAMLNDGQRLLAFNDRFVGRSVATYSSGTTVRTSAGRYGGTVLVFREADYRWLSGVSIAR